MNNDAKWVIEMFQLQLAVLRKELSNPRIKRDKFDKYSYSSWAIVETLLAIDDYSGYVTVGLIREILTMQLSDYDSYYRRNPDKHLKYKYAHDMIENLLELVGGWIYDE